MKKTTLIPGILLAFLFMSSVVLAETPQAGATTKKEKNAAASTFSAKCKQMNCKGNCDPANKGKNTSCPNFTDKDKNGTCDNFTAGKACCGNGPGKGQGTCNGGGSPKGKGNCCGKTAQPAPDKPKGN